MKRTTLLTAGILTFAILLTGCSGASGPSPQERMEQAQATIENAEAITMSLTGTDLPSNVDGIQAATGTGVIEGDLIKFEGEFQGKVSGIAATVAILAIGDDTYMKLFTPSYEPVDLGTQPHRFLRP